MAARNAASSDDEPMSNLYQTSSEDARQYGTDRPRQHDADHELVELGLAAIQEGVSCENPDVEHDEPGEQQDESAPIERSPNPSIDHRTSGAVRRIDHRRPSASFEINHPTNQVNPTNPSLQWLGCC